MQNFNRWEFFVISCFTILDNMKNVVVAKLVHQTSDFYADAMKLLQLGSIREIWPKVQQYNFSVFTIVCITNELHCIA